MDSDQCSLSTKIHYAQLARVNLLIIKYIDDKIEEAEIERSSFSGVKIPVLLIRDSEAKFIVDVLNSTEKEENHMTIEIRFKSNVDMKMRKIQVFMTADIISNPVIQFLKDLQDHKHLIRRYSLEVKYVIGKCNKCQKKNFMSRENGCLSGGRYCVINTQYRSHLAIF